MEDFNWRILENVSYSYDKQGALSLMISFYVLLYYYLYVFVGLKTWVSLKKN